MPPVVSVIITTYSRPHLLRRAVQSVSETGQEMEVVVVDDASTDGTRSVCESLHGITYVRLEQNHGVAGARLAGIHASSGEYVAFLDDDDVRLPGTLDQQCRLLTEHPDAAGVYGQLLVGDQHCRPTGVVRPAECPSGDLFWQLLSHDFTILLQSAVLRRACIEQVGWPDPSLPGIDDWDLFVRLAERYSLIGFESPVFVYREPEPGSGQGSSHYPALARMAARHQPRLLQLPRAAAASPGQRREARRRLLSQLSRYLLWDAGHWLPRGARLHAPAAC